MAKPQLEDGYTRIANEILESLGRLAILGAKGSLLFWVIRNSYGKQGKWTEPASIRQIAKETNMSSSTLQRAAFNLLKARVIEKDENGRWRFQKDWEEWLTEVQLAQEDDCSRASQPRATHKPPDRTASGFPRSAVRGSKGLPEPIKAIILKYYEVKKWAVPAGVDKAFSPHIFAARSLYAAAGDDLKMAIKAIDDLSYYMSKQYPDGWGLNAIARAYPDWEKELTENDKKEIQQAGRTA